jgi:predicted transcriptional regulator
MVTRHLRIMRVVIDAEPIGIVKVSNETGYPHHKVRYSFRTLEEADLIEPTKQGATTTEQTPDFVDNLEDKVDDIEDTLDGMKITM